MKIIIFGASGKTGHELVKQGLHNGHQVTAFVRNPIKLKINHPYLQLFEGDVVNYRLVEDAIKGHEAVLSTLGASSPFKFDQAVVDGVGHIITAMKATGVNRLIYMSFIGVSENRGDAGFFIKHIAPRLVSTEIAGHQAKENLIKRSPLRWTIIHPPGLTNGKHRGRYQVGENIAKKGFMATISRADVADFMLKQLNDNNYLNKTVRVMY